MITLAQQAHLTVLYNEPHRYYHNLSHIQHCLRELSEIPGLGDEKRAVLETAIWFHDAVYDPKASKGYNENASINLMYSENLLHGVHSGTIEDLIAATVNHQIPADESPAMEELMGLFLDIDLSILGQDEVTYDLYASLIREEYMWVPLSDYREGRRKLLVNFLSRKRIYFSEYFYSKYEAQARANLSREALALIPERPIKIHEE